MGQVGGGGGAVGIIEFGLFAIVDFISEAKMQARCVRYR